MRLTQGSYKGQLPLQVQANGFMNGANEMMMDPYAPSIVQDLLAGNNDWKNI
jgi:hypothetical protein